MNPLTFRKWMKVAVFWVTVCFCWRCELLNRATGQSCRNAVYSGDLDQQQTEKTLDVTHKMCYTKYRGEQIQLYHDFVRNKITHWVFKPQTSDFWWTLYIFTWSFSSIKEAVISVVCYMATVAEEQVSDWGVTDETPVMSWLSHNLSNIHITFWTQWLSNSTGIFYFFRQKLRRTVSV